MPPLAMMLCSYQQKYDVESKALAKTIGISESSLCRIKQGKLPDAEGLSRIITWMIRN